MYSMLTTHAWLQRVSREFITPWPVNQLANLS
jgi:hypothetical protein